MANHFCHLAKVLAGSHIAQMRRLRRAPTRQVRWWLPIDTINSIKAAAASEGHRQYGRYVGELAAEAIERRQLERTQRPISKEELASRMYIAPGWRH